MLSFSWCIILTWEGTFAFIWRWGGSVTKCLNIMPGNESRLALTVHYQQKQPRLMFTWTITLLHYSNVHRDQFIKSQYENTASWKTFISIQTKSLGCVNGCLLLLPNDSKHIVWHGQCPQTVCWSISDGAASVLARLNALCWRLHMLHGTYLFKSNAVCTVALCR